MNRSAFASARGHADHNTYVRNGPNAAAAQATIQPAKRTKFLRDLTRSKAA